jgi:hypothetical protein
MAKEEKDPDRQRARTRGVRARWQKMLRLHRRLIEIRPESFSPDWRVRLQGVLYLYALLWRVALPASRKRRKRGREKDQEIKLALDKAREAKQWGAVRRAARRLEQRQKKVPLPSAARLEVEAFNRRCGIQLSFETIEDVANFEDRQRKRPWIHTNLRYDTWERSMEASPVEIKELETIRPPHKKRMWREDQKLMRKEAVRCAMEQLERKQPHPSVRQVQRTLKPNQKMSLKTVWHYMSINNLRKP